MICKLCYIIVTTVIIVSVFHATACAEKPKPDHIRGQIMKVEHSAIVVKTNKGSETRLKIADNLTVFRLAKASFTDVDFGTYVGSVSVRLDDYSPIVRDSLSWLHRGFELRIFEEQLRGLALGHTEWDLTPESVMTHGWVDDLEIRVISIKFGPTEEEETDVDIPRDVPICKISLGDKSMIKQGANVFAGAVKDSEGNYMATFVFVGEDGAVPAL